MSLEDTTHTHTLLCTGCTHTSKASMLLHNILLSWYHQTEKIPWQVMTYHLRKRAVQFYLQPLWGRWLAVWTVVVMVIVWMLGGPVQLIFQLQEKYSKPHPYTISDCSLPHMNPWVHRGHSGNWSLHTALGCVRTGSPHPFQSYIPTARSNLTGCGPHSSAQPTCTS